MRSANDVGVRTTTAAIQGKTREQIDRTLFEQKSRGQRKASRATLREIQDEVVTD